MREFMLNEHSYITSTILKEYKKILIVWSGGYDSTLILCRVLNIIHNMKDKVKPEVCTITLEDELVGYTKLAHERESRERIKYKLLQAGYEFNSVVISTKTTTFMSKVPNPQNCISDYEDWGCGLAQPQLWISQVAPIMGNDSLVVFGYMLEDEIWQYKHEFLEMFRNACKMRGIVNIGIAFPLRYKAKTDIIGELMDSFNDVYKDCWCCESPENGEPCGICHACETRKDALIRLLISRNFNLKEISEKDIKNLLQVTNEIKDRINESKNTIEKLDKEIEEKKKELDKKE